jgi:hypothetical protein
MIAGYFSLSSSDWELSGGEQLGIFPARFNAIEEQSQSCSIGSNEMSRNPHNVQNQSSM